MAHFAGVRAGAASADRVVQLSGAALAGPSISGPSNVLPPSAWSSGFGPVVISGAVGLLVLLACCFAAGARRGSWLRTRLAPHLGPSERRSKTQRRKKGRALVRGLVATTEHAFANVKQFRAVQRLLTRADVPLLASELLYACLGSALAVAVVMAIAGVPLVLVVLFMLAGAAAPLVWVVSKARRRMKAFDNQLPDLLITIAASLKAGHSFRHAIQAVVDEGAEPYSLNDPFDGDRASCEDARRHVPRFTQSVTNGKRRTSIEQAGRQVPFPQIFARETDSREFVTVSIR